MVPSSLSPLPRLSCGPLSGFQFLSLSNSCYVLPRIDVGAILDLAGTALISWGIFISLQIRFRKMQSKKYRVVQLGMLLCGKVLAIWSLLKRERHKKVNSMWLKCSASLSPPCSCFPYSLRVAADQSLTSLGDGLSSGGSVTTQCSFRLMLYTLSPTIELQWSEKFEYLFTRV